MRGVLGAVPDQRGARGALGESRRVRAGVPDAVRPARGRRGSCRWATGVICSARRTSRGSAPSTDLAHAGVASLKIEGRLKAPEYVAGITRVYRAALDLLTEKAEGKMQNAEGQKAEGAEESAAERYELEMSFSRGLYSGWLHGIDNQRLVHARFGKKRGVFTWERVRRVRARAGVRRSASTREGRRRRGVRRRPARRAGTGRARLHGGGGGRGGDDADVCAQRGLDRPLARAPRRTGVEDQRPGSWTGGCGGRSRTATCRVSSAWWTARFTDTRARR